MEGSTSIRLRAFLDETGTRQVWLAEEVGVTPGRLGDWLACRKPIPEHHRHKIIAVLRRRQLKAIPRDLFDQEADGHGHDDG